MSRGVGFRIYQSVDRPSTELIELFRGIPVANIADNMNRLYCMNTAIKPMNGRHILGSAYTVKTVQGDNLIIHKAMDIAQPGDILVIDGCGYMQRSLAGEIMFRYAENRNLGGLIFDGTIRDIDAVNDISIPIYARGATPRGPFKNGPGEINVPICCGGQVVLPGDIIVGDSEGVVVIRPEDAQEIATMAKVMMQNEQRIFNDIAKNCLDRSWVTETCDQKKVVIYE